MNDGHQPDDERGGRRSLRPAHLAHTFGGTLTRNASDRAARMRASPIKFSWRPRTRAQQPHTKGNTISLCIILGLKMTKSRGIGRGGARPGSGAKTKADTPRPAAASGAPAGLERRA